MDPKALRYTIIILLFYLIIGTPFSLYAEVKIKFIVMNPSEKQKAIIPIKYTLPEEIKSKDVINSQGLKVDFDVDEKKTCVVGEIELGPKETKTYQITVNDVWKISDEKMKVLRESVQERLEEVKSAPNYETAKNLADNIINRINNIEQDQAGDKPIAKRVDSFRMNQIRIESIENDMLILGGIARTNFWIVSTSSGATGNVGSAYEACCLTGSAGSFLST